MKTKERQFGVLSLMIFVLLIMPPVRAGLEWSMTTHVAVQLAGLALAGWLLGAALRRMLVRPMQHIDANGLCGLAVSLFAALFWMLPRTLDDALGDLRFEIAKLVSVPLLVGFPIALSWPRLHPIFRGVLKATLISKLVVLGWLYTAAPTRFCLSYFQSDQALLGELFLCLAGALALAWSIPWFVAAQTTGRDDLAASEIAANNRFGEEAA